jgi:hypothetical protein
MPEMNKDDITLNHGRGAGVAILPMNAGGLLGILLEHLNVPDDITRLRVQSQRSKRIVAAGGYCRGEEDSPILHNGR